MSRFILWSCISLGCLAGLVAVAIGLLLLTTPRPTNIRSCFLTSMYHVRLCPTEPGYVRIKDVSPAMRSALIVSEDGSFYSHQGIDWFELRESFEKNWRKGEFARGGSTITQQLAKNVYLSPEKSLLRKIREAIITVQIEGTLSKDEILEKYLNVVEFGPGLFGIAKASEFYFQKTPAGLNVAESAFLAFLLPSPQRYSISFNKKKLTPFARAQMKQIIGRLLKYKKISQFEYDDAVAQVANFFGSGPSSPDEPTADSILPSAEELDPSEDLN